MDRAASLIKFLENSPPDRIARSGMVRRRTKGWVIMDAAGEFFLQANGTVSVTEQYWPSRDSAREFLRNWCNDQGVERKPGPKRGSINPERAQGCQDRAVVFERLIQVLMYLWGSAPNMVTAVQCKQEIEPKLGVEWKGRVFHRDLDFLVATGFATKHGSAYKATDKGKFWYERG